AGDDQLGMFWLDVAVDAEHRTGNRGHGGEQQAAHRQRIFQRLQRVVAFAHAGWEIGVPRVGRTRYPLALGFVAPQLQSQKLEWLARKFPKAKAPVQVSDKIAGLP